MSASRDIAATLSNPSTSEATAVDALVEFIQARRKAGASLYDVTLQLMELLQKTPPALDAAFDEARLATHLPPHTDLTPDLMSRSLSRTISKAQVGAVLSQLPEAVTLGNAREVVLEWALGLEASKSTPEGKFGGKGTVSVTALEDIGAKFDELAEALGGGRRDRQIAVDSTIIASADALALLLSIRLSLGYLNEEQLLQQLETLPLSDGEAVLRHYVKRRLPAEGRYTIGKCLEGLEIQADRRRPALKAVIRTVKRKYLLPEQATYRIPQPPQNKSKCVSSIQSFVSSSAAPSGSMDNLDEAIAAYAFEILSEFCLKEKRDYMRSEKWIKSGRKGLSKDVNDIEEKLSGMFSGVGKRSGGSPLLPVFDVIRRLYNLEAATSSGAPSFSPTTILDERATYYPPTAQSVTSALYCNPRLETAKAVLVLIELVDYEKDLRMYAVQKTKRSMTSQDSPVGLIRRDSEDNMAELAWGNIEKRKMATVLESIERRFPEGDYREAFQRVAITTDCPPRALLDRAPSYTTVASDHTKSRTIEYLVGDVPGYQASPSNGKLPAHISRPSIRTKFSSERWDQGRSPLAERLETLDVAGVPERSGPEMSPTATRTAPAAKTSHSRTGSLPGLWNTSIQYQSPPRTNGLKNSPSTSSTPLHPADGATNRMAVNISDVDDRSMTEDEILALYAGRSPVMVTPIERGPFTFGQNNATSPSTSPSSAMKQTSPRFDRTQVEKSSAPPPSSSSGGLSSLFRKGSKFVRRGDQGESSRAKVSLISPIEAGPAIRSVHPSISMPGPTMALTSDLPHSQSPENGGKKRSHTRQAASLEPTAWRQQFLNSGGMNMPRPAPKSASQGNLT